MTSERALPPHLPTLTTLLEDYSATTGRPLTALARVTGSQLTDLRLSDDRGNALTPAGLMSSLISEIDQLIKDRKLPTECELRLHTVANPPAEEAEQPPSELPKINNDGLVLRSALLTFGHGSGCTSAEIREDAAARGKTLPEISFYRSLVREGKVAEGPAGNIYASPIGADFNEGIETGAEAALTAAGENDSVQPLLAHKLWVEIAHDHETRYAADLAPGPAGRLGQIIARPKDKAQVPYPVAQSLAQFVTGRWLYTDTAALEWQTVISLLEPSQDTAQIFLESGSNISAAESYAAGTAPEDETEADTEDEILDLSQHLETHNADRLNETERHLADDFAAGAFDPRTENNPPVDSTNTSAGGQTSEETGFKATLKKFFLGG